MGSHILNIIMASLNTILPNSIETEIHPVPLRYLELTPTRRVAYRKYEGYREPTVLYVPGFFAPMDLRKTVVIEEYAIQNGYSNVRYDQECVGKSTGSQTTIEFEHWIEDAIMMLDHVCQGPVILVASSLGAWISTILAQRRPHRIHSMLFIGPGFNALQMGYWHHYNLLPDDVKARVDAGAEHIKIKMRYGGVGILRKDFCDNTAQFEIDFGQPINVQCPVRIIHAIGDKDVPYESSILLMERLSTSDVDVILKKTGDHRLNTRVDHGLIISELDRLLKQFPVKSEEESSTVMKSKL